MMDKEGLICWNQLRELSKACLLICAVRDKVFFSSWDRVSTSLSHEGLVTHFKEASDSTVSLRGDRQERSERTSHGCSFLKCHIWGSISWTPWFGMWKMRMLCLDPITVSSILWNSSWKVHTLQCLAQTGNHNYVSYKKSPGMKRKWGFPRGLEYNKAWAQNNKLHK